MRLDLAALLRDGWAMWARDRVLLLPLAGATLFLPSFAAQLLISPRVTATMPADPKDDAAMQAATQAMAQQLLHYLPWMLAVQLVASLGIAILWTIYLDRRRPTLMGALGPATELLLRYIAAMLLLVVGGGIALAPVAALLSMIVPVAAMGLVVAPLFYLLARLMLIGPALAAERPLGPIAAIRRSWQLTRGYGWKLAWVSATIWLFAYIVVAMFGGIEAMLTGEGQPNPVLLAITTGIAVVGTSAAGLAGTLVAIAAYRRLSSSGT